MIKLKPKFEFDDLKMSGKAELGMNGVILPGKEVKPAPVKDFVSILMCTFNRFSGLPLPLQARMGIYLN